MSTTTTTHSRLQQHRRGDLQLRPHVSPTCQSDAQLLYSGWNTLNPAIGAHQQVTLTTAFSAGISIVDSEVHDFNDPAGLTLGKAALVTDQNNQSPTISGTSDEALTPAQVGVDNETASPPVNLSVLWYVNNNKVVETNNTKETSLAPGFISTFELHQSVWVMLGQKPQTTTTYTAQTFNRAVEIPIPNGASDLYIEAYTDGSGRDTFRPSDAARFEALVQQSKKELLRHRLAAFAEQENQQLFAAGAPGDTNRGIIEVRVLDPYGDPLLTNGVGRIRFNGPDLVDLSCTHFSDRHLPTVGKEYVITGKFFDTKLDFKYTLKCTESRGVSHFSRDSHN